MAWTQATIDNLKPKDKPYKKQEDNLVVKVQATGLIVYYAYIRREYKHLGEHPILTLRKAKMKKNELFHDKYMGKLEESKLTFEEFVYSKDFQEWSEGNRVTHQARMASMKATILPLLGKVKLSKITKVDINRYKNARLKTGVKQTTINRELTDISGVLTQAFEFQLIRNKIKVEKYSEDRGKERRTLEDWEVKNLRQSAKSTEGLNARQRQQKKHIPLIIDIALWCGLRKGEILQLNWGDIVNKGHFKKQWRGKFGVLDNEEKEQEYLQGFKDATHSDFAFYIRGETTKTKQTRLVPIAKGLFKRLYEYYSVFLMTNKEEYEKWADWSDSIFEDIFVGKQTRIQNKPLAILPEHLDIRIFPYNNVDNAFNTARDNAGLGRDITLHSLRHHFCSKALESGMSLHCVKDLAGHASITTTEIYLHTNHRLKFEQYQMFEQLMMTEIN